MNVDALVQAQVKKASHSLLVERAERATIEGATLLAALVRDGAKPERLDEVLELAATAYRTQLQLLIKAAEIDREIEEAHNG